MFRKKAAGSKKESKDRIKWRGHEVTRIEAFSDAVFAFAVTLLIVSLEVPKSSTELLESTRSFIPFAFCFLFLFQVWYAQNIFFRRFALQDVWTITLNGGLLFVVLFYVYPLKFIASLIFTPGVVKIDNALQARQLFYVYGWGFCGIYIIFTLMYYNAMKRRHILELNDSEAFETRTDLYENIILVAIGLVVLIIAALPYDIAHYSWMAYFLIGPFLAILNGYRGKRHKLLFENKAETKEESEPAA